ncbi:MAG: PAS domain-containing protein [Tistlia sp.]|uniref:PAS domain-containing protein n=1 Tax=Tistlia sp. TaxID=3057121 RepID=UPI0034A10191
MLQPSTALTANLLETNGQFLAYWLGKLEGGCMPWKSAIDPAEMPRLLPDLVLYERRAPDDFHIRLAGTAVVRRVGVNPTGNNVLDLLHSGSRATLRAALNRILDEPCGHVARVRDQYPSGREAIVEVLRLPLRAEEGEPRFIISSTAETSDDPGWSDPQEKPELLAELLDQSFFGWRGARPGEPAAVAPLGTG